MLGLAQIDVHNDATRFYAAVMTERNGDMSVSGPRRVTVEDASRVLGISESTIRKRIERNTLRSVPCGRTAPATCC